MIIHDNKTELEHLCHHVSVGLIHTTGEKTLLKANQHISDIFGYSNPHEMAGISMCQLHLSSDEYKEFTQRNFQPLKDKENLSIEFKLRKKDGTPIWCEISGKALDEKTPADLTKGVIWTVNDISQRKKLEETLQDRINEIEYTNTQLRALASKDYLTGLYNRSKLDETIGFEIKRSNRHQSNFGLILLDIDYFKEINDTHGHQVGDKFLCEFSNLLLEFSRETDQVGRWGGEEFLIIVEDTCKDNIMIFAEKLRRIIENHTFSVINNKTVSLGVTIYQKHDDLNHLMSRVDNALYTSKDSGRNIVTFL